jgi:prenyltransferase beta subunit
VSRACLCVATLLVAAGPAGALTPEERAASVRYVLSLRQADGGFADAAGKSDLPASATLRGTSSALRAIRYLGGETTKEQREQAAAFIASCFDEKTGGFAPRPGGKPDVPTTAVGVMAVFEVPADCEKTRPDKARMTAGGRDYLKANAKGFEDVRIAAAAVEALGDKARPAYEGWYDEVAKARNADGSWGTDKDRVRATGGAAVVLLRLGGPLDKAEAVRDLLAAGQAEDGAYAREAGGASDLETTYRVMRALHMLKARPAKVERLREYIARCRNADGGYGVAPGKESAAGATYFAAVILHWLDE